MAQFWNPQGQPQAGSAPTPQSPEEAAYWAAPASTRAFMVRPGSTEWNRRQADQVVNDQQFAAAGITDPFGYALKGAGRPTAPNRFPAPAAPNPVAAPAAPQPYMPPQFNASQPQPSLWQPPSVSAPAPQPYMPPQDNASQPQPTPTQQPTGSVLGQMTPKPYQPTNFNPAQRTTQSNGGAVSGYSGNPAFAAYSRKRGIA